MPGLHVVEELGQGPPVLLVSGWTSHLVSGAARGLGAGRTGCRAVTGGWHVGPSFPAGSEKVWLSPAARVEKD